MSEEKETGKLSLTAEQLQAIVGAAVNNAIEKSSKILAEAILESKKPYENPLHVQNEKTMRESMRETSERIRQEIAASQQSCPHMQGSNALSDTSGLMTSIVHHRLDYGDIIGICTNCQRRFLPGDSDYLEWMRKKSANRMSQAGQRQFYDTAKVIDAGRAAIGANVNAARAR